MKTNLNFTRVLNGQKFTEIQYLFDAINIEYDTETDTKEYDVELYLRDVSCASGSGNYICGIEFRLNDETFSYRSTSHNEDYRYCFKTMFNDSANNEEEKEQAQSDCQSILEFVIDNHIEDIRYRIISMIENSFQEQNKSE